LATDDAKKVEALLEREGRAAGKLRKEQKLVAKQSKATSADKALAKANAEKAQKRYLALKEYLKQEQDRRAAALAAA